MSNPNIPSPEAFIPDVLASPLVEMPPTLSSIGAAHLPTLDELLVTENTIDPKQDLPEIALSPDEIAHLQKEWTLRLLSEFAIGVANLSDDEINSRKPKTPKTEAPDLPHATRWGNAALKGKPMTGPDLLPTSRRDFKRALKAYEDQKHLGTLDTTLSLHESGVYKIGHDGKSQLRDSDGKLSNMSHAMKKSIRKTERKYRRTHEHHHHVHEELAHSGDDIFKRATRKISGKIQKIYHH